MCRIDVHSKINLLISLLYKLALWHRGDKPTNKESLLKCFYSTYYLCLVVSLFVGAFQSDDNEKSVSLALCGLIGIVLWLKLYFLIWKKAEIVRLLNEVCVYTTADHEGFTVVNQKLNKLAAFVSAFMCLVFANFIFATIFPFITKTIFHDIAFPLDYKNDETAFWFAVLFLWYGYVLTVLTITFNGFMWYWIISCALRYELLGRQIVNMGHTDKKKLSVFEENDLFNRDLLAVMEIHAKIKETINQLGSFLNPIFIAVFATSGLCICASLYSVIFNPNANLVEICMYIVMLVYCIFDIFLLTYLGNEIHLKSDHFTYCFFESDWIDRPQSTKKSIIILCQLLKHPHRIFVLKLFPLKLETFTRILNSAYTMFNVLQNFK